MIDLAVLGLLSEGDLHGYELKKRLREIMGPLSSVSFGSLYPALARLERDGLVEAVTLDVNDHSSPSVPMTGSLSGEVAAFRAGRLRSVRGSRNKKVYRISRAGRIRLCELIAQPAGDERNFNLKLAFCRWAEPHVRLSLLERRRAALVDSLSEGRRSTGAGSERIDRYVRSLMEHQTESTERDIAWIDRLIAAERTSFEPVAADHVGPSVESQTTGGKP